MIDGARFWNDDVLRDMDNACQHIVIAAGLGEANHLVEEGRR